MTFVPNIVFIAFLVSWCVVAKEERGLAFVELLARELLINFEHPLYFLALSDHGFSEY